MCLHFCFRTPRMPLRLLDRCIHISNQTSLVIASHTPFEPNMKRESPLNKYKLIPTFEISKTNDFIISITSYIIVLCINIYTICFVYYKVQPSTLYLNLCLRHGGETLKFTPFVSILENFKIIIPKEA